MAKTLTHEKTGRTVTLSDDDPNLEMYVNSGWKETKSDGARKPRRGGTVSAKDSDDAGADKG